MTKYLDDHWFDQLLLSTAQVEETFTMLEPTVADMRSKRTDFEKSGYSLNLPLFPAADVARGLQSSVTDLLSLRLSIESDESNEIVSEVYLNYIDDLLLNIDMIKAAAGRDAETYRQINHTLYGNPDTKIFADACAWIRRDAESELSGERNDLSALASQVLGCMPEAGGDPDGLIPPPDVFQSVRDLHFKEDGFFDLLFGEDGVPAAAHIGQSEGDEICQRVLNNIGAGYRIVDAPSNTWAVTREPRQLLRPVDYRLGTEEFIGLIGHEIGSHILESVNGAKQPLRLFEMGLAGYLKGNEGRALIREQIVYPTIDMAIRQPAAEGQPAWEFNIMKHLAVCLSLGYGGRVHSFSELYDVLYRLYRFWRERRFRGAAGNEAFAREHAWFLAVRIMKGTDGKGGCYRKDIVYLEGNVKLWQMAADDPRIILMGDGGKFNLLDPRHREIYKMVCR